MELASKIKNALTPWLCALVVTLTLGETRAGEFFAAPVLESGQIHFTSQASIGENYDASQYDAPGYAVAAKGGGKPLALGYDASTVSYQAGKIRSFTTQSDEVYYRVFSGDSTAGAFLSKTKPRSADWATEAFALPPGNRADFIQEVLVPAGTRLQRSRAAPNIWGRGGAEQFEILKLRPNEFQPVQFGTGVPFR